MLDCGMSIEGPYFILQEHRVNTPCFNAVDFGGGGGKLSAAMKYALLLLGDAFGTNQRAPHASHFRVGADSAKPPRNA